MDGYADPLHFAPSSPYGSMLGGGYGNYGGMNRQMGNP